jgi:hypothetical protein
MKSVKKIVGQEMLAGAEPGVDAGSKVWNMMASFKVNI